MDPYNKETTKKSLFSKVFGKASVYEEVCEKLMENKTWPFEDYGPFFGKFSKQKILVGMTFDLRSNQFLKIKERIRVCKSSIL